MCLFVLTNTNSGYPEVHAQQYGAPVHLSGKCPRRLNCSLTRHPRYRAKRILPPTEYLAFMRTSSAVLGRSSLV